MSERSSLVQAARDLLAEEPRNTPCPSEAESDAIVAAMAEEIVRARKRVVRRRFIAIGSIAAAIAIGAIALGTRKPTVAYVPSTPAISPTIAAPAISVGHRIRVPTGGNETLTLPSGSRIEGLEGADLTVAALGALQSFTLGAGEARFAVKKLEKDQRFLIHTVDAEVEVRGTTFTVTISEQAVCGSRTRVAVAEGVVEVRHAGSTESIGAGSHYPSCAPSIESAAPLPPPSSSNASTIAAQNQLFGAGIDARKRGDRTAALAAFKTYLQRYPSGFLAESAEVERMRLLTGRERSDAASAYLARYPQGFARGEAKSILSPTP